MRASVNTIYGLPEVLKLQEIDKPTVKDDEVLVKIYATTVNRTDCGFRKSEYLIIRFIFGLFKPKHTVLGSEFAGKVEAIGKNVSQFKVNDDVFGLSTYTFGTHAEYICIKETKSIAKMPVNMSYNEAAAVCDGLMLGMNLIRKINFKDKPKVLINGTSGSIGTACVQLAHFYGAEVSAVCKTDYIESVKALGAAHMIDYTLDDFTKSTAQYDVVIDAVGKSSFFKCKKILKPKGIYFSTELGYLSQNIFLALITPLLGGKKVKFPIPTDNKESILFLKKLIEKGNYKAVIDKVYPLDQIVAATKYVETGEKIGNVVITVV
jgi:NADPH:quinone reductase-like Zn-dependent oxidoreductase